MKPKRKFLLILIFLIICGCADRREHLSDSLNDKGSPQKQSAQAAHRGIDETQLSVDKTNASESADEPLPTTLHGLPVTEKNRKALAAMSPAERRFCAEILNSITAESTKQDILTMLGKPSRSILGKKLNWWVKIDEKKDRIGVYFSSSDKPTGVVLDGGWGRFYYRCNLTTD